MAAITYYTKLPDNSSTPWDGKQTTPAHVGIDENNNFYEPKSDGKTTNWVQVTDAKRKSELATEMKQYLKVAQKPAMKPIKKAPEVQLPATEQDDLSGLDNFMLDHMELQSNYEKAQEDLTAARSAAGKLGLEKKTLEDALKGKDAEIERLTTQVSEYDSKVNELVAANEDYDTKLNQLLTAYQAERDAHQALRRKLAGLTTTKTPK